MIRRTALLRALLPAACVLAVSAVAAGAPTINDLKKLPARGQLTSMAKRIIGEFVRDGIERMKQAKTMDELRSVRTDLEEGYKAQATVYYQWEYAAQYAAKAPAMLSLKADALTRVKEIYASMIAAEMERVTIQPALVAMAAHKNPGVRYWAVRGYRKAGRYLLQHGGRHSETMFATLSRRGMVEQSAPVLAELFRALSPYRDVGADAAKNVNGLLDKVWLARCKDLRAGKADVARAYLKALPMVARVQVGDRKLALQLFADAMSAASSALVEEKNQKDEATAKALMDLLKALEEQLASILSPGQRPIQAVLDNPKMEIKVKALEAGRKLFDVWRPKLNDRGVKVRVTPTTSTAPATAPAKG